MRNLAAQATAAGLFDDAEPVIQSHPLLPAAREPGAAVPLFGDAAGWDFNDVVRRPANLARGEWKVLFTKALADPGWNLLAREYLMIVLNPRHPALRGLPVSITARPQKPGTVIQGASRLRRLAAWAQQQQLPAALGMWDQADVKRYTRDLADHLAGPSVVSHVAMLDQLHRFAPALTGGGLTVRASSMITNPARARAAAPSLSTKAVAPQVWFPLVKAAWTYVHVFGPDIVRAARRYEEMCAAAVNSTVGVRARLEAWLEQGNAIPIRHPTDERYALGRDGVNWRLLETLLGIGPAARDTFPLDEAINPDSNRALVYRALERGHHTTYGVIDDLAEVTLPDGTRRPWHPGLNPRAVQYEQVALRDAAFVLVVALSMMRDSEIHEIERGSVIEYYGSPAVRATKHKLDHNLPEQAWWVIDAVAKAIVMAEEVSRHPVRVFAPLAQREGERAPGVNMIKAFARHVNATSGWTGLEPVPPGRCTPHMWRRTMAMLTDQFPGSEIALGIQLKHVAARALANRSTGAYAASDPTWARHLESAIDAARFRGIQDLYARHKAGESVGHGPGAARVVGEFERIRAEVAARHGDASVELALLRNARVNIRFGTLNHCTADLSNLHGAVCLQDAALPEGAPAEPLIDRCRPDRCANAMFGPEHVAIHDANRRGLLTLLNDAKTSACRRAVLERELAEIDQLLSLIPAEAR